MKEFRNIVVHFAQDDKETMLRITTAFEKLGYTADDEWNGQLRFIDCAYGYSGGYFKFHCHSGNTIGDHEEMTVEELEALAGISPLEEKDSALDSAPPIPEPKFKAGDKVFMTNNSNWHGIPIGQEVVISAYGNYLPEHNCHYYDAKYDGFTWAIREGDFMLVEDTSIVEDSNHKFGAGDVVKITGNRNQHEFKIGQLAVVERYYNHNEEHDEGLYLVEYEDGHDYWYVLEGDMEIANPIIADVKGVKFNANLTPAALDVMNTSSLWLGEDLYGEKTEYRPGSTEHSIYMKMNSLMWKIIQKNIDYCDSLQKSEHPLFEIDNITGIMGRINDKLNRLRQVGLDDTTEDTVEDLIGYFIHLLIAKDKLNTEEI